MPPKKTKPPAAINVRLKPEESRAIVADVDALRAAAGIPLTLSAYAKHAVLEHARLRKIESNLRSLRDEFRSFGEPDAAKGEHGRIVLDRLNFALGLEASK